MSQPVKQLNASSLDGQLSDEDFATIQIVAQKEAGLVLPTSKQAMVASRLSRRLRTIGCNSIPEYLSKVEKDPQERSALISVLTTNVTSFFREVHHFQTLAEEALPSILASARSGGRVRIWSAGCSSGQEPYSIAMLIANLEPKAADLDIKILATDVDRAVLDTARKAHYRRENLENLPLQFSGKPTFEAVDEKHVSMPTNIRDLVSFKHLNLHEDWPMRSTFDIIMCRNVVIYFDAAHQSALWPRFLRALSPGGWLFLGHSERIHPTEGSGFVGTGLTTYRRETETNLTTTATKRGHNGFA